MIEFVKSEYQTHTVGSSQHVEILFSCRQIVYVTLELKYFCNSRVEIISSDTQHQDYISTPCFSTLDKNWRLQDIVLLIIYAGLSF